MKKVKNVMKNFEKRIFGANNFFYQMIVCRLRRVTNAYAKDKTFISTLHPNDSTMHIESVFEKKCKNHTVHRELKNENIGWVFKTQKQYQSCCTWC